MLSPLTQATQVTSRSDSAGSILCVSLHYVYSTPWPCGSVSQKTSSELSGSGREKQSDKPFCRGIGGHPMSVVFHSEAIEEKEKKNKQAKVKYVSNFRLLSL